MTHAPNEETRTEQTSEESAAESKGTADIPLEEQAEATAPPEEETAEEETVTEPEKDALSESQALLAEEKNRFLRLYAEFENYKKRTARNALEARKYANEALIKALLPVLDNLERAIDSAPEEEADKGILEGVRMTRNELLTVLGKFHVTPVESIGRPFNPSYHEAMGQESSEEAADGAILREFQKGYLLHERLIRPAMVVIAKNTAPASPPDEEDAPEDPGVEEETGKAPPEESAPGTPPQS